MTLTGNAPLEEKRAHASATRMYARESRSFSPALVHIMCAAFALIVAISLCSSIMVLHAHAATWPVSTSELSASVFFRQTYTAGAKSYAHSGLDIPAPAGTQVASPLAGLVRFTGAIPSGDARTGGASPERTMLAVSLEVEGGRTITLMPLSTIGVSEGQVVSEGEAVGTLAASGDVSSGGPHLHMGYKQGSTYLDPMQLFGVVSRSGADGQAQAQSPGLVESAPVAPAPEASMLANGQAVTEAAQSNLQPNEIPETNPALDTLSYGTIETGDYALKPRESGGMSAIDFIYGLAKPLLDACYGQFCAFVEALAVLSRGTGIPLPVLLASMFLVAALASAGLALIAIRLALPRVGNMWRIQKSRLSKAAGGDSMHKLFPAPGAAFMSRGRIARGR